MKSLKQLFDEMGFNPEAPLATQKAFFKHLSTEANKIQSEAKITSIDRTEKNPAVSQKSHKSKLEKKVMTQLEFDFSDPKRVS